MLIIYALVIILGLQFSSITILTVSLFSASIEEGISAKPNEDVDLRKLSMTPFPSEVSKESTDTEFSLFGKEDVDYRQLQFPPLPMPPIFPCAALPLPLPGIVSNFLPGIVHNAALAPAPAVIAATCLSVTSTTTTMPITSPEQIPPPAAISQAAVPVTPEPVGLIFNELAPPGLTITEASPFPRRSLSPVRAPTNGSVMEVDAIAERSIDLTAGIDDHMDTDDIVCIDDVPNGKHSSLNPYEVECKDDYYSIVSDIDDQLQWGHITRLEYNLLMVRLQETDRNNQLELFRTRFMTNMKNASGVPIVNWKKPQPNKSKARTIPKLQPPQLPQFDNFHSTLNHVQPSNGNITRMPVLPPPPPPSLVFPVNNIRPVHAVPTPQACTDAYGETTYQYNPPANMVPRNKAPDTSIDLLQSILANIGQVPPARPSPPQNIAPARPNKGRNHRRGRGRSHRTEITMAPIDDQKWIPKKEDMWKSVNLKRRNDFLIKAIYYGTQCSSCGLRFKPEDKEKYARHLDWHFRMNKKQQESTRKANCRNWFVVSQNWKMYEEMDSEEPVGSSLFDEISGSDGSDGTADEAEIPSVAVSADDPRLAICPECTEKFTHFFHHDLDEWHYKNAIQRNSINYHPSCYEDVLKRRERVARNGEDKRSPEVAADQISYETELLSPPAEAVTTIRIESPQRSSYRNLDDDGTPAAKQRTNSVIYIKEETISVEDGIDMFVPPPQPRLLADLPLKMEIKEEPVEIEKNIQQIDIDIDEDDNEDQPAMESDLADNIDGNDTSTPITDISRPSPVIRISMSKSHNASPKAADTPTVSTQQNVIRDLLKPAFDDLHLVDQPPKNAGMELSSLCSIM